MGNTKSQSFEEPSVDYWWKQSSQSNISLDVNAPKPVCVKLKNKSVMSSSSSDQSGLNATFEQSNDDKLDEFRQDFARKHEKRRQLIAEKRKEMQDLRLELLRQKKENEKLRESLNAKSSEINPSTEIDQQLIENLKQENDEMKRKIVELQTELFRSETIAQKNNELRCSITELQRELQSLNAEVVNFEKERQDYQTHVTALKDVIKVSKEMLRIRESQLNELRQKVSEIEASLAGREMNVLSEDLRQEYERQLRNIRNLRTLYEERQRADKRAKEELATQLEECKRDLETANNKSSELESRIGELEVDNSQKYDNIKTLESNLGLAKAECRELQAEMSIINQLFSHILLGFNNCQDIDLDKLIRQLEENHDILQNIVINEESNASSALPKVFLDLVTQVNDGEKNAEAGNCDDNANRIQVPRSSEDCETQGSQHHFNSVEQIVENLPKVWKVLIELLSHQNAPPVNVLTESQSQDSENPCYKVVETPKGPRLVLSVSQTFIRLKNLILEKKSLEKETSHLKQLNTHLEVRLQDQEKRLELVSSELSKTWHVVGKMQKQHQQLHTQEKILRYELAQKRKMLTELKEELEYCREKWLQAREKNTSTEMQWKQLRTEFASRKTVINDDLNNSVESGYSDERECSTSDEEEPGYETDISECNQKVSSPETVSDQIEVPKETTENNGICNDTSENQSEEELEQHLQSPQQEVSSTILNVIRTEITDIEDEETVEPKCSSDRTETSNSQLLDAATSSKEILLHSETKHQKTDLVQNVDETKENLNPTELLSEIGIDQHKNSETTMEIKMEHFSNNDSSSGSSEVDNGNSQEMLSARDLRLKRLEEQTRQLMNKVTTTTNKSVEIDAKLTNLHELYGGSSQTTDTATASVSQVDNPSEDEKTDI